MQRIILIALISILLSSASVFVALPSHNTNGPQFSFPRAIPACASQAIGRRNGLIFSLLLERIAKCIA